MEIGARIATWAKSGGLPAGLRQVQYLEFPGGETSSQFGGAYIDTGIVPANNPRAEIVARYLGTTYSSAAAMPIFGIREYYRNSAPFFAFWVQSSTLRCAVNYGYNYDTGWQSKTIDTNSFHALSIASDGGYVDGVKFVNYSKTLTTEALLTVCIGGVNQWTDRVLSIVIRGVKLQVKSFKMWNDDELVGDFVSTAEGSTGYMYNRVNGLYLPYGNAGTYSLGIGPDGE